MSADSSIQTRFGPNATAQIRARGWYEDSGWIEVSATAARLDRLEWLHEAYEENGVFQMVIDLSFEEEETLEMDGTPIDLPGFIQDRGLSIEQRTAKAVAAGLEARLPRRARRTPKSRI